MNSIPTAHFSEFIEFFPLLDPPFSLLPDIGQIPSDTLPLPGYLLEAFILPFEGEEADELTEYIPYGRISSTKGFYALIYWKAGLMQYEYILATYNLQGEAISHAIIGGLRSDDEGLLHSVAVIQPNLSITIAEGIAVNGRLPDLDKTNTYQMAIQPSGQITYGLHEED